MQKLRAESHTLTVVSDEADNTNKKCMLKVSVEVELIIRLYNHSKTAKLLGVISNMFAPFSSNTGSLS